MTAANILFFNVAKIIVFLWVHYLAGLLVLRWSVRVNYTRKITHFAIFIIPLLLRPIFPFNNTLVTSLIGAGFFIIFFSLFYLPVRQRFDFLQISFAAVDRPEDRPHTLTWLVTQMLATFIVLIPMQQLFHVNQIGHLIWIPIIIACIGDGLAEPVGVRFGRNKYETRALFTNKKYTRTLEGSCCVFISAVAALCVYKSSFTSAQFLAALALLPALATLAEARSPHTWDAPFLYFVTGLTVYSVKIML